MLILKNLLRQFALELCKMRRVSQVLRTKDLGQLTGSRKQKRQQDAGAIVEGHNSIQELQYDRSNSLSRKKCELLKVVSAAEMAANKRRGS